MKHPLLFASPFVLALFALGGAQVAACDGGTLQASDAGADTGPATGADANAPDDADGVPVPDASTSCSVNGSGTQAEDFIDFCFQKKILAAEHKVFDPKLGVASSWSVTTGNPDTDGGAIVHSYRDDVAYGASLGTYAISAEVYGDSEISASVVVPDLTALSTLVQSELATLPASYDGELYMRLRRFAQGLDSLQDADDGAPFGGSIDAIADAYGRAIYQTYFHSLAAAPVDGGAVDGGDAGDDAGTDGGGLGDGGDDAGPTNVAIADGILGVSQAGGGYLYDVDQAASGALALVDMANRHLVDSPAESAAWARAAGAVFNHLYTRARHSSGLYYADLVTSSDPGHDALANVVTPSDALLTETSASVAASLMRASTIVTTNALASLSLYPFATQVVSPLSGLQGISPDGGAGFALWDPTPTTDTTAACALLEDASACGGSGFFVRYLPSGPSLDNGSKTLRGNALAFVAVQHSLVLRGAAAGIDFEPLQALFESTQGVNQSFVTQEFDQVAYLNALSATLGVLPTGGSYSAQANAYAIEALTEQWVGQQDCPPEFY
jgi:hypothetical protein